LAEIYTQYNITVNWKIKLMQLLSYIRFSSGRFYFELLCISSYNTPCGTYCSQAY